MLAIESTHDQAFLADLHVARLHALGVLRSILNLSTLTPEARAEFLKSGRTALALLRESRLAAAQILQLPLAPPRATTSPRDHQAPPQPPHTTNPPASHPVATPQQPVPEPSTITRATETRATGSPPPRRQPVREPQDTQIPPHTHDTSLLHHTNPTPAAHLRARSGAAP